MSERYYRPIPTQRHCIRCGELFVYFRTSKPRIYCAPCIPVERQASNDFYNTMTKLKRFEARRTAREAHG